MGGILEVSVPNSVLKMAQANDAPTFLQHQEGATWKEGGGGGGIL